MLFGPANLFGFKLEMMLEISSFFFLVGDKKNDIEELFSMYSEKCLCKKFTLALVFSVTEAK